MQVGDLMTQDVRTFNPETSLRDAATILVQGGISGAPVCNAHGNVLGVLSETDILFKEQGSRGEQGRLLNWFADAVAGDLLAKQSARTVGEAMSSPAITVSPGATVAQAARMMTDHGINRLPVVEDEKLVGLVTRTDLVRAFSRPDDEIRDELADVVQRQLWIPLEYLTITVQDGEVQLSGKVDSRTEAELVSAFASRVPGVVAVDSKLQWRDDDLERRTRIPVLPRRI